MLNKKGFTLVEIIVAIALLGIISVGFLTVISNNLNFIQQNRETTESVFAMQQQMELAIDRTREEIDDASIPLSANVTPITISNAFGSGINVQAYQLKETDGSGKTMYTLISEQRMPEFPVPIVETISANLKVGGSIVDQAYAVSGVSVVGNYTIDPATTADFLVANENWYVSREGFNIPYPNTVVPEYEVGTKYPSFPNDYTIIPAELQSNLTDVTAYGNRHIVYAVTPAGKSGRLGDLVASEPVFVSGLPKTGDDLVLHLDGVVIDQAESSEIDEVAGEYLVEKWVDLSKYNKPAEKITNSSRPTMIENSISGDFVGKYVDFDSTETLKVNHSSEANNKDLFVFAVAKGLATDQLFTNGSHTVLITGETISNGWTLISPEDPTGFYHSDSSVFDIGLNDVDIAEIIIYRGTMTQDEIDDVEEYLKNKYMPLDFVGEIISLYNMNDTIYQFDPYVMPTAALADMAYGPSKYVEVSWSGTIDNSILGPQVVTGTAIEDNTKTMQLTVEVLEPIHPESLQVLPNILTLYTDTSYDSLTATVLPDEAHNKSVVWTSSNESVATVDDNGVVSAISIGNAIITATTVDGGIEATCSVTVEELIIVTPFPEDMVLWLDANESFNLYNDSYIRSWYDKTSNDNDFESNAYDTAPYFEDDGVNFNNIVKFDNDYSEYLTLGDDYLQKNSSDSVDFYADNDKFTLFLVGQAGNRNYSQPFLSNGTNFDNKSTYTLGLTSDNDFQTVIRGSQNDNKTNGNNELNIHMSAWDGSNHSYELNTEAKTGMNAIGSQADQNFSILLGRTYYKQGNSYYYGNSLDGSIGEVIVFDRILSDAEEVVVEEYLMEKWINYVGYVWWFDDYHSNESWTQTHSISNLVADGDGLYGVITGSDPYVFMSANIQSSEPVDLDKANRIKIRLKNSSDATTAQFYFTTGTQTTFSEVARVNFNIEANSDFTDYYVDMTVCDEWKGEMRRLRFDPATNATSGSFEIDYIKIIE